MLACRVLVNESACFEEISINFLGARAVRSLNRNFTGRDEVTDTLAFEIAPDRLPIARQVSTRRGNPARRPAARRAGDPNAVRGVRLGDVVVCVDRAVEQAEYYGVGLDEELARLTVHGLLHLCGLDDATPAQRLRMRRREDFYLRRLDDLVRRLVPGGPRPSRPIGRKGEA